MSIFIGKLLYGLPDSYYFHLLEQLSMRILPLAISGAITVALIVVLNNAIPPAPPLGSFLSPSHGFWKNAESVTTDFSLQLSNEYLEDSVQVILDDRLVPHVFAQNDKDAYFVQGYLHATFRLWQMEFQTHAAAGRLCELFGEKVGENSVLDLRDRHFRRLGMVWAAEKALENLQKDIQVRDALNAYTAGVNAYLSTLTPDQYPIEYKLLDYEPEEWTPLKCVLFLKYMSYDLARDLDDFEATNLRNHLGNDLYELAFPIVADSLDPISPKGTAYPVSIAKPVAPRIADSSITASLLPVSPTAMHMKLEPRHPDIGSNNWVVGGAKTQSGRPILCNDPHLGLNMPSLWYEMQIHTPDYNVYGVSFPGAPAIVIGFNDSITWGVTNAMRDVMDFYEVQFKDSTMNDYLFNGNWVKTTWRNEVIKIKDKADFVDKVAYTDWGPVMFDRNYGNPSKDNKAYVVRWAAHDESLEVKTFMNLNRASNYEDYLAAIKYFSCPGQNFVFASKANQIAWWQQANFPAKWRRQGDFVMPGIDSTYAWQTSIPQQDNIHMVDPARGFVSSANQMPADTNYPFYIGGTHDVYRGKIINRYLGEKQQVTTDDMEDMQTDNYNLFAEMARPILLQYTLRSILSSNEAAMLEKLQNWNLRSDPREEGPTIFDRWWSIFSQAVWLDNIERPDGLKVPMPQAHTLVEALLKDSSFYFIDNIHTPYKETLSDVVTASLKHAVQSLQGQPLAWADHKATGVRHLLHASLPQFSREKLPIGGGANIINAATGSWGPSWRMIVEMTDETNAKGIYPGGQHGNPGSKFYDTFVDDWAMGAYHKLALMKDAKQKVSDQQWVLKFEPVKKRG